MVIFSFVSFHFAAITILLGLLVYFIKKVWNLAKKISTIENYNFSIQMNIDAVGILLRTLNDHIKTSTPEELSVKLIKKTIDIFCLEFAIIDIEEFEVIADIMVDNTALLTVKNFLQDNKINIAEKLLDVPIVYLKTKSEKANYEYELFVLKVIKNQKNLSVVFAKKFFDPRVNSREESSSMDNLRYYNFLMSLQKEDIKIFGAHVREILQLSLMPSKLLK